MRDQSSISPLCGFFSGGFARSSLPSSVEAIRWEQEGSCGVWVFRVQRAVSQCPRSLQVVLVTDGCLGIGRGSLRHSLATHSQRSESNRFPLPFPFPSKLYVMCMANLEEVMSCSLLRCWIIVGLLWPNIAVMFLCLRFS